MSRLPFWLKLAPPLTGVLLVAVLLAPRCSPELAQGPARSAAAAPDDREVDPDRWAAAFSSQRPPPAELTDDPSVTRGALDNGFQYAVVENTGESERVSLRLLVKTGSVHEEESERGLAHFVEHMAFQGTATLRDHSMKIFERLGLKSGADTNAWTARDCTAYKLDLPVTDEKTLDTAFQFLRDVADGILFDPAEVDSERRVVLREMEERETKKGETDLLIAAILPDVRAAQRAPIGLRNVIENATPEQLRSFWRRHYVSSRMTLIATGDFRNKDIVSRIARHFAALPGRVAPAEPPGGDPLAGGETSIDCLPYPVEAGKISLTIASPQPEDTIPDSLAKRRQNLVRILALRMMANRLGRAARASRIDATAYESTMMPVTPNFYCLSLSAETKRASIVPALRHLAWAWRSARDTGFNDAEFDEARGQLRTAMRRWFSQSLCYTAPAAADALLKCVRYGLVYDTPEDWLNLQRTLLSSVTRRECEELGRGSWNQKVLRVLISGDVPEGLEDEAAKAVRLAWEKPAVAPPVAKKKRDLVVESFGPAGRIKSKRLNRDTGCLEVEFENHVLACLKPLPGLGGCATVSVHTGFGPLAIPPENPGLGATARFLVNAHPLPGWSEQELAAALADTEADFLFFMSAAPAASFQWRGETDRSSLRKQLELLCAVVARPGFAALETPWKPTRETSLWVEKESLYGLMGPYGFKRFVTGEDDRFRPRLEAFLRTDSGQLKDWLVPILNHSRLCVVIAGDFSPLETIPQLARTFGALPDRDAWSGENPYAPLPVPGPGSIEVQGSSPQAEAILLLPRSLARTPEEAWHQALLTEVTNLRLRQVVRESLGESYSPRAELLHFPGQPGGWLVCRAPCAAGRAQTTGDSLRSLIETLRREGWNADEYLRAARPLVSQLHAQTRDPAVWGGWLIDSESSRIPGKTDLAALKAMEPEVKKLMQRLFDSTAIRELHIEPKARTEVIENRADPE